jgi:hypothetical protein
MPVRRYTVPELIQFLKKPERKTVEFGPFRDMSCYVGGPLYIALEIPEEKWWARAMLDDILSLAAA